MPLTFRAMRAALLVAGAASVAASQGFFFHEDFQGPDPLSTWTFSAKEKYEGQPVSVEKVNITGIPEEKTLLLKESHKHYGVARKFDGLLTNGDKPLVVQYEVKFDDKLDCGGAYVKLLQDGAVSNLEELDNETPYVIMFGPDKCGSTNKVHFILRHQNPVTGKWEEKHAKDTPSIKTDKKSHLYTLIVRPDNSWEILVDNASAAKGSLLKDMEPAVNPPEYIDDPSDSKPDDWVDEAKIADPDATKPEDWDENAPAQIPDEDAVKPAGWLDDEPDMVPDPEAEEPDDWDEEQDGEWEAPLIPNPKCEEGPGCGEWERPYKPNPAYKGKWHAPMIDNPAYKGEWKPSQIKNPDYFKDETPSRLPAMSALALEIWTINGGLRFDNFLVDFNEGAAKAFADKTWKKKFDAEKSAEDVEVKSEKAKAREELIKEGGWKNIVQAYVSEVVDAAKEKPWAAGGTLLALLASLFFLSFGRKPQTPSAAPTEGAGAGVSGEQPEPADVTNEKEDKDETAEEKDKKQKDLAKPAPVAADDSPATMKQE